MLRPKLRLKLDYLPHKCSRDFPVVQITLHDLDLTQFPESNRYEDKRGLSYPLRGCLLRETSFKTKGIHSFLDNRLLSGSCFGGYEKADS